MSTPNVVLNCLKPKKKLLWGIRNIFQRKTERGGFFHIKWLTTILKIIYLKKKKPPKRTSANQMQPFEGYDAPMFIIDLTVLLLHC